MLYFLAIVHISMVDKVGSGQSIFIVVSMLIFTLTHFFYFSRFSTKTFILLNLVDFLFGVGYGYMFPESNYLYLLFFGVVGVTLFLGTSSKGVLMGGVVLFTIAWLFNMATDYYRTGSANLIFNIICFVVLVLQGCMVGGLIRYLLLAQDKISDQYKEVTSSHMALQEAHEQMRRYAEEVEILTSTRERNQIAREIHDTVGHKMTALLVQLEVAQMIQESEPLKAKDTIQLCKQLAQSALQEVRLSVRAIHEEVGIQLGLIESLRKLLTDFSEMTGVKTSLQVEGDLSSVSATLQPIIYRVIQESLTNAKRHGNATQANVNLHVTEQQINIEIADNGAGVTGIVPGFGLINMRERVEEHSGMIQFISKKEHGFLIKISFPLQKKTWTFEG
ncbi:sensor histidine kinase [Bacillus sp. FJAT-49732]|uniref:histidine kinase n=1 Tax=Lederbergia citrisecunda TaxID=2833583 RepID=A0A942TIR2_9BACI|nr:sensor histidine kinase [Lederbergia citrisecunda]MBS4198385.1 sensor histidine kinase [Lederbergia citrisecunda]